MARSYTFDVVTPSLDRVTVVGYGNTQSSAIRSARHALRDLGIDPNACCWPISGVHKKAR